MSDNAITVVLLIIGIGLVLLVTSSKGRDLYDVATGRARVVRS